MADRNPGTPLNPAQMPGVQEAIPANGFLVPSHVVWAGGGSYAMNVPVMNPVQIDHAQYSAHDVPFTQAKTDHKP